MHDLQDNRDIPNNVSMYEEINDESVRDLPNAWCVALTCRSSKVIARDVALYSIVLPALFVVPMASLEWCVLCGIAALTSGFTICYPAMVYMSIRPFGWTSLAGTSIWERDGEIVRRRRDGKLASFCAKSAVWREYEDLRDQLGNRMFPHRGCIVITPARVTLFNLNNVVVCGLTDVTREKWRQRLREDGAVEDRPKA